jgi:hypothetical protein
VPGFLILGEGVFAAESWGSEQKTSASRNQAHWQDVPGLFGHQVGDHKIQFGFFIRHTTTVNDALDAELISAVAYAGAGFYLHAPDVWGGFHQEVVSMHLSVGLGYDEAEAHGFVHEGYFAKVSSASDAEAAGLGRPLSRAPPGRWIAPG